MPEPHTHLGQVVSLGIPSLPKWAGYSPTHSHATTTTGLEFSFVRVTLAGGLPRKSEAVSWGFENFVEIDEEDGNFVYKFENGELYEF